jgi:hypothetical protein
MLWLRWAGLVFAVAFFILCRHVFNDDSITGAVVLPALI